MSLPLEYHPSAERELEEAADYYDGRAPGLGGAFLAELRRAAAFAAERPLAGTPLRGDLRRVLLDRFPYTVVYVVEPERIYVLAVAHSRRRPRYWAGRQ